MPIATGGYRTLIVAGSMLAIGGVIPVIRQLLVATREPSVALEIVSMSWVGSLPALLIFCATLVLVVGLRPERGIAKSRATRVALLAYGATWLLSLSISLLASGGGGSWVWAGTALELSRIVLAFAAGGLVARDAVLGGVARWALLIVAVTHLPAQLTSFVIFPAWAPQPSLWEQVNLVAILFWGATYVIDGLPRRSNVEASQSAHDLG